MSDCRKWSYPLTIVLILLLAACGGSPTPDPLDPALLQNPPATQPIPTVVANALPTDAQGEQIVATVNGQAITLTTFEREVARRQQVMAEAASPATLRAEVLDQLIEQEVTRQGAAARNITISDEILQAELQVNVELAGSQSAWEQWLTTNLYTQEEFAESLRSTLINNLVRDVLTADLEGNVRQVHARHILVRTQAEAQDAMARISAGEDFAALAVSLSMDEMTRQNGGDLGWFTQEELLVPELAQVAFSLQPGQVGGPVGTTLGYHLVQTIEFEDRPVDPDRRVYIAQARFENWLRPLYENAVIERYL
ncbi:MAG: peptidylprolyl isomerase [Anaerolineae bacterium]|nr:peptidylprolyl isomerase [Anaerolineae bacterium]